MSGENSHLKRKAEHLDNNTTNTTNTTNNTNNSNNNEIKHSSPAKISKQKTDYLYGFGNDLSSEVLSGAIPIVNPTPQKCPYGLIAEQLSGTSFTTPRQNNKRTWLYRLRPSSKHPPTQSISAGYIKNNFISEGKVNPAQTRWFPFPLPTEKDKIDFVQGIKTLCGAGEPTLKQGMAIHIYTCNTSMDDKSLCNCDGDLLIVPQLGCLTITTECGILDVAPNEIVVVPRGMKFSVKIYETSRGYICEIYNGHFQLPELGPIGANGLASARDFAHPVAWFEDRACAFTQCFKYCGEMFQTTTDYSPFDVVGYSGNYLPYKYDLSKFIVVNSVSVCHLDPSIFTVLTCPTNEVGVAVCDFAIFPPRWAVQMNTFRPPYYHRNCMSEFMGNIYGQYDAKPEGFKPGAASLHSCMMGHGPDANAYNKAIKDELKPVYMGGQMAFMFESCYTLKLTEYGNDKTLQDENYYKSWTPVPYSFDPNWKPSTSDHNTSTSTTNNDSNNNNNITTTTSSNNNNKK